MRGGKANGDFNRRQTILLISNHGDNPFREKLCVPKTTKNVVSRNYAIPLPKKANSKSGLGKYPEVLPFLANRSSQLLVGYWVIQAACQKSRRS